MPRQQGLRRRQHAVGAPSPLLSAMWSSTRVYWPRLISATGSRPSTPRRAIRDRLRRWLTVRSLGPSRRKIFCGDGRQGVALGRALFLALALLGGARIATVWLGLAQRLGGKLTGRRQRSGVASSGVASDSATPRSVRHGPSVSLRCKPPEPKSNDEGSCGRMETRPPATRGSRRRTLRSAAGGASNWRWQSRSGAWACGVSPG